MMTIIDGIHSAYVLDRWHGDDSSFVSQIDLTPARSTRSGLSPPAASSNFASIARAFARLTLSAGIFTHVATQECLADRLDRCGGLHS